MYYLLVTYHGELEQGFGGISQLIIEVKNFKIIIYTNIDALIFLLFIRY
jgi:hypothetical protein